MSPKPSYPWKSESKTEEKIAQVVPETPVAVVEPTPAPKQEPVVSAPKVERAKPTVVMTQVDSYLHEVISAQPDAMEKILPGTTLSVTDDFGLHRMSLPEFFEKMSYDCTRGNGCKIHAKDENGKLTNKGKFIFRWLLKDKRAIDYAKNVRGWLIVSQVMADFRDAPQTLFNAHGGVEVGDAVLAVLPMERALRFRRLPAEISRERLKGQITPSKTKAGKVLLTGNPDSEHIYEPDSSADEKETGDGTASTPGSLQEGRDF